MIFRKRTPPASSAVPANDVAVPQGVRIAAAWSWRLLLILAVLAVLIYIVIQLRLIVIPLLVSTLLAALLVPFVQFLRRHRWPKWLAVTLAELGLIGVVSALVFLVVAQVRAGFPDLQVQSVQAWEQFKQFLLESPLHLTDSQITQYADQVWNSVQQDSQVWVSGALSVGSSAGHFLAGLLLTLFTTLFILIDGRGMWEWTVRLFPKRARVAVDKSGRVGWATLTSFVRVQIFVAAIDAIGIGVGALVLGLPLAIPIAALVFLGSFIPIVGAVATGALAVFVALIYKDVVIALIMLAIVLLVQQIEGHVLQPLVMGSAVKVHPVAVVFAVAAGSFLAGIPGALFAVPVVAVLNVMIRFIASGRWRADPGALSVDSFGKNGAVDA
ncbi:AI-2E family transporter [Parafrigoribacterium mesophilum]|uniref:AI-2E family transporter n=1 Tax=Parafrigoribacterium mesophilum TaxID=433646 RepID=UPI0031FD9F32